MTYHKTPEELLASLDILASSSPSEYREIPKDSLEFVSINDKNDKTRIVTPGIRVIAKNSDLYLGFKAGEAFFPLDSEESSYKDLFILDSQKGVIAGQKMYSTTWRDNFLLVPESMTLEEYLDKSA